jgi:branched-chain amino acid transport system ATP-binding protein
MTPIVEVRQLTKRFGGFVALSGINLAVAEGERLGVIGPNGSGKSTLMNCIMGTLRPNEGSILLDGKDLDNVPSHRRTHLGLARSYQIPRPFGTMTVLENILLPLDHADPRRASRHLSSDEKAEHILREFGLLGKADTEAKNLSQIELRRLELARAAATTPRILISDESMAGLSHSEVDEVLDILFRVSDSGVTVIMIEHIMRAVMRFSHRIVCLDAGTIMAEGSPNEIVKSPEVRRAYLGT